ncbi:response regulator transcription factor [Paraburkholderia sediminicola]|uniref:response regulator transcription factor n=1 Tax=Paraburkholderia sediminicola TaxID=458836 RepID=UPI0038B93F5F
MHNEALTSREIEVLAMLAEGLGNKEITRQLAISDSTVKFHLSSIFGKLGVTSRTEAVMLGMRHGFIMVQPVDATSMRLVYGRLQSDATGPCRPTADGRAFTRKVPPLMPLPSGTRCILFNMSRRRPAHLLACGKN